jgi:formylglycine-generating enzyme required for sulfatase activity
MRRLLVLGVLVFALPAHAVVTIDWVMVGDPGNEADTPSTNCYAADCGSVAYDYWISKYEVTNAQYAALLNAKAASDPLELYNTDTDGNSYLSGITRSGVSGSYTYSVIAGFANKPVNFVSFYDSLRFSNWLNNGQGSADTETGAYTITPDGITNNAITRNQAAQIFLPSENEWYKAAYYSASGVYFDYPVGTNAATVCAVPTATANRANCDPAVEELTNVGAYTAHFAHREHSDRAS